ncbi:sigma-70 family RNA polymerase sigma factor [Phytoactinopolyspora halotolerans]|uniref:Sigma-70 family RNA polymerase sigma factor n=1 Tax=Phytoactinopolyspora halotolerans TaxID=1981512 RepID=A0A6L9SH00_9ACTN|nr:sigma-70 family RNA polymerase sigma factor [Phytoactinopolyspora halotolerans]NEE04479.1 sigma-70 family RNA polymerase sigma factor [Phytoactinopolyspora halotolerans]
MGDERSDGGHDGFDDWYVQAFPQVRGALALAIGDADLAEEAAAEAFTRALVSWRKVHALDSPTGWVYATALNHVRSTLRRLRLERRHQQRLRAGPRSYQPPPEPEPALWRAVAELPPRTREAVALRYVADLSEAQVAAVMGVSAGTVAATLHQARRRLAQILADDVDKERTR